MRSIVKVCVGAWISMFGCGDDGVSISTTADNVCGEVAEVACHDMYRCCSEGEIENYLNVMTPRSEGECRDDIRKRCERAIAPFDDGLANKRLRFDSNLMDDCLEALVAPDGTCASIETMLPWQEACMESAWVGIVASGGDCRFTYECEGGSAGSAYCAPNRACKARPTENQPCLNEPCATGLYCATTGPSRTCKRLLGAGAMCNSTAECDKTLFCDTQGSRTCQALRQGGETCTSNQLCASGQCIPGVCSITGQGCYRGQDCGMRCETSGNFCSQDSNCGNGTCSMTGGTCSGPGGCTGGIGDVCNFAIHCVAQTCQGDIVCEDNYLRVDYCTGALSNLPI
jgi:hypothetical protein